VERESEREASRERGEHMSEICQRYQGPEIRNKKIRNQKAGIRELGNI
jgi:hypothetical protein